jgi:hypothetical protein
VKWKPFKRTAAKKREDFKNRNLMCVAVIISRKCLSIIRQKEKAAENKYLFSTTV